MNDSQQVRKGEELDASKLVPYLAKATNTNIDEIRITQFAGGYSNITYLLTINDDTQWVLRKPPKGANIKSGHDMSREYKILTALKPSYTLVPQPIVFCSDEEIIGSDFYIMEKVEGWILRANILPADNPSSNDMRSIFNSFIENFVNLHNLDYRSVGLESLGNPDNYIERQINGWTKRYINAKTDDLKSVEQLYKWLVSHMPYVSKNSLIHNDYKYDNLILDPSDNSIKAVLDWEMSTLGDPLMDLGSSLAYWVNGDDPDWMIQMKMGATTLPGNPTREEVLHLYADKAKLDPGNGVFYFAYGMLKLAVIAQQIYYRYKSGHTNDARFAHLIKLVDTCGIMANQAIASKKLDRLF